MDTTSLFIQIPPREIAYLSFILESYEGVAIARTVDPHQGLMELMVAPDYQEQMQEILKDLSREFPIRTMGHGEACCSTSIQGHEQAKGDRT